MMSHLYRNGIAGLVGIESARLMENCMASLRRTKVKYQQIERYYKMVVSVPTFSRCSQSKGGSLHQNIQNTTRYIGSNHFAYHAFPNYHGPDQYTIRACAVVNKRMARHSVNVSIGSKCEVASARLDFRFYTDCHRVRQTSHAL